MNGISLETFENRNGFVPGETIEGLVSWELDRAAEEVEVRLLWFTSGKGDEDAEVVETVRIPGTASTDVQPFAFTAPDGPASYDGRLLSITWAIDAVAKSDRKRNARLEIVIGPTGRVVVGTKTLDIEVEDEEDDEFDM